MSSAPTAQANDTPHEPSMLAAFLSYLIPGLGQIYQGRYGKGFLFMVCLLGMFLLGQAMGNWQNVYIHALENNPRGHGGVSALVNRWHYGGQFWIGIAAWPALWQHFDMPLPNKEQYGAFVHDFQKMPNENEVNAFLVNSDKTPDLGWVYTVVAGMLNILVIYDAYAGPVFVPIPRPASKETTVPEQTQAKKEGGGLMLFAMSIYWHLPLMLLVISLVYSATRHERWDEILGEAFRWGIRMFGFMLVVALVLFGVSLLY